MKPREEIIERIETTLGATSGVSQAAYFGSIATDDHDEFSDFDVVVCAEDDAPWQVISGLHHALGIVLFRPFSEDRRPGGRYWFKNVSPFQRLDISFRSGAEFAEILREGKGFTQPPFRKIRLRGSDGPPPVTAELPDWTQLDFDFALALRHFHDSAKSVARSITPKRALSDVSTALLLFAEKPLKANVWELGEDSLKHLGVST